MNFEGIACNLSTIKAAVPHHIWEAQVFDRIIPTNEARIFHNKIIFFGNDLAGCYAGYFSPEYLSAHLSFVGFILFLVGIWYLVSRKKFLLPALLILLPIGDIFLGWPVLGWVTIIVQALVAMVGAYKTALLFLSKSSILNLMKKRAAHHLRRRPRYFSGTELLLLAFVTVTLLIFFGQQTGLLIIFP